MLERAGLIERRVERQWRYLRVRADALEPVESWLSRQRSSLISQPELITKLIMEAAG